jgi:hypothetical protein
VPAIVSIAVSMSTSSNTTTGALPPSSRCTRLSVSDAVAATFLPLSTLPVIETMSTPGWRVSAAPVSPAPTTTFSTPLGRTSAASSARRSVVSGVVSAGLRTIVLPVASAGPIFQIAIISG